MIVRITNLFAVWTVLGVVWAWFAPGQFAWVTDGTVAPSYRLSRNPMKLGIAVMGDSLGRLLTLPFVVLALRTQVIGREEAYLEACFRDPYREYCRRVRRWL